MDSPKAFGNIFHASSKVNDRQPDARGDFRFPIKLIEAMAKAPRNADGYVTMEFAAWTKQGPKAGEYLSGNLTIKQERSGGGSGYSGGGRSQAQAEKEEEDDIPF